MACDENPRQTAGSNVEPSSVALKELEEKSTCTGDLEDFALYPVASLPVNLLFTFIFFAFNGEPGSAF